jgi:hypothetical protein
MRPLQATTTVARSLVCCAFLPILAACGEGKDAVEPDTGTFADVSAPDAGAPAPDVGAIEDSGFDAGPPDGGWPGAPIFETSATYPVTTPAGDEAAVYYPNPPDLRTFGYYFPVALLLQAEEVDKKWYSGLASRFARYGFIVVVPNHVSKIIPGDKLNAELSEIDDALQLIDDEQNRPESPIMPVIMSHTMVVLGDAFGGQAGLYAIQGTCTYPFCDGQFFRPDELKGGAFFGVSTKNVISGEFPPIDNAGLPVLMLLGSEDGLTIPEDVQRTYGAIKSPPKMLVSVEGANHFGATDVNPPEGSDPDPGVQTLAQEKGLDAIARWMGNYLRAYVLGDETAKNYVDLIGDAADPDVTVVDRR